MLSRIPWFTSYDARKSEWLTALYIAGFGLFLGLPFESMHTTPGLIRAVEIAPEYAWAWGFGLDGSALVYVLHVTPERRWAPYLRAVLFAVGMILFLAYGTPFLQTSLNSPAIYIFFASALLFCGGCFIAACREAGINTHRKRHQ